MDGKGNGRKSVQHAEQINVVDAASARADIYSEVITGRELSNPAPSFGEILMTEFSSGDIVRVEMPRGYSIRGVLGISLMFSTSVEAKFEGAIGTIAEINPVGPHSVHQYLVDFRTHDNSRIGIPWQAQWFREEWLALVERPALVGAAASVAPDTTWPDKPVSDAGSAGIAHPDARLFRDGIGEFTPTSADEKTDAPFSYEPGPEDRSAADEPTFGKLVE